jgi:hypothetical protein
MLLVIFINDDFCEDIQVISQLFYFLICEIQVLAKQCPALSYRKHGGPFGAHTRQSARASESSASPLATTSA